MHAHQVGEKQKLSQTQTQQQQLRAKAQSQTQVQAKVGMTVDMGVGVGVGVGHFQNLDDCHKDCEKACSGYEFKKTCTCTCCGDDTGLLCYKCGAVRGIEPLPTQPCQLKWPLPKPVG